MNRETWLNELAALMAPRFAELGFPLPKFRVSVGFTSLGANSAANGQCWADSCTDDKHFTIFISPAEKSSMSIAAILNHELIHCAVGIKEGHKGKFAQMMKQTGMQRPFTSSIAGDGFQAWVQPFIDKLGEIPHSPLKLRNETAVKLFQKVGGGIEADEGEPETSAPKKQTTRLIKCVCSKCGYTVRTTQKWLDVGPPHCPEHGAMDTDADGE